LAKSGCIAEDSARYARVLRQRCLNGRGRSLTEEESTHPSKNLARQNSGGGKKKVAE